MNKKYTLLTGISLLLAVLAVTWAAAFPAIGDPQEEPVIMEYRLLATKKTSTMEKELNQAASEGFYFESVMGGETSFGGKESVSIMSRPQGGGDGGRYHYKLLATGRTSKMQKEMQEIAAEGYIYRGQTIFKTTFGGKEVVVIMELDRDKRSDETTDYRLLATKKTSTMQKEIREAAAAGYQFVGISVAETRFGGKEMVVIMHRRSRR